MQIRDVVSNALLQDVYLHQD